MPPEHHAAHILVVNHAPAILDLQRELLGEEGYRVTTLLRPDQTIDTIVAAEPDLIILDYMWPQSDNEWTLLNLLRIDRRARHIPVIVCSAAVRHVQEMEGHLRSMAIRVVFKLFDIDHLIAEVKAALEAAPTEDPRPSASDQLGQEGHGADGQ